MQIGFICLGAILIIPVAPVAAGDFIADAGDFISFKILPVYSFGATVYNSNWNTWYDYDWIGLMQLISTNLFKSSVTDILKGTITERRPDGSDDNSFPSGHTANAFAQAAFIHRRYGITQAIVPYALAGFVGFSRIQSRAHYTHDVLAGAAIGFLSAWIFTDKQKTVAISADTDGVRVDFRCVF